MIPRDPGPRPGPCRLASRAGTTHGLPPKASIWRSPAEVGRPRWDGVHGRLVTGMERTATLAGAVLAETRVRSSARRFLSATQRNDERVGDYVGDYEGIGLDYTGRLAIVETKGGIRTGTSQERGGPQLRARWADDALGAVFLWGDALTVDLTQHAAPRLVVAGPGTEVVARHQGAWRNLRVGVHGAAFTGLLANPASARTVEPWARPGIHRPAVPPALEWRLQRQICLAGSLAEQARSAGARLEPPSRSPPTRSWARSWKRCVAWSRVVPTADWSRRRGAVWHGRPSS